MPPGKPASRLQQKSTSKTMQGATRIGISGWRYAPWRGRFYPKGLAQRLELDFASRMLPTIEINGSFYSLQRPESYQTWHDATPDDFVFAVKGPRYITHNLRLMEPRTALANFFASGVFALGSKLGPILWQLPPYFVYNADRLEEFFTLLPRDGRSALALARQHNEKVGDDRALLKVPAKLRIRHALEVRHASFANPEFIALLRRHGVALVVADTAGRWPLLEDLCADFVYMRLHGDKELYASGYSDEALDRWAERIDAWRHGRQVKDAKLAAPSRRLSRRKGRDVYCYFDNDVKVHAPYDAAYLAARLGVATGLGPDDSFVLPPGVVVRKPARERARKK
jgi:uncharacterized protein YecE (DUF72 family)